MRRVQLFELEDQPWLPTWVRDAITEHISRVFLSPDVAPLHAVIAEQLADVLERTGGSHIVDLCSGAGGPLPAVLPLLDVELGRAVTATLTDRYPNRHLSASEAIGHDRLRPHRLPVDVRSVPPDMSGVRTVFNAIHHFRPVEVAEILRSATRGGSIVVFEPFERRWRLALRVACGGVLGGWRDARSYRGSFLRTAVLHAVLPVALSWDGAVSVLRAYEADELLAIAEASGAGTDLVWRAQRLLLPWGGLTFLAGERSAAPPDVSSQR